MSRALAAENQCMERTFREPMSVHVLCVRKSNQWASHTGISLCVRHKISLFLLQIQPMVVLLTLGLACAIDINIHTQGEYSVFAPHLVSPAGGWSSRQCRNGDGNDDQVLWLRVQTRTLKLLWLRVQTRPLKLLWLRV